MTRVYRWEILKLLAQKRTYLGLGTAMIVPIVFVVVLLIQKGGPNDIPVGRYIARPASRRRSSSSSSCRSGRSRS